MNLMRLNLTYLKSADKCSFSDEQGYSGGMSTPGVAKILQRYLRITVEDLKREMEGTGL